MHLTGTESCAPVSVAQWATGECPAPNHSHFTTVNISASNQQCPSHTGALFAHTGAGGDADFTERLIGEVPCAATLCYNWFMRSFGQLLVIFTERAGISDSELARTAGVGRQTIFRWKEGLVARPRYREDVLRLADKLRLSPAERDELLLAAGFSPQTDESRHDGKTAPLDLTEAALDGEGNAPVLSDAIDTLPPATGAIAVRSRLFPNPGLLLGAAIVLMLLVALAGYFLLPAFFGPRPPALPTPVAVVLTAPTPQPAATSTPVPLIVAAAGEKLLLVAPFVGYTSEELRFNVAGRIQEALDTEIADSALDDVRVAALGQPVTSQVQARDLLAQSGASAMIWGEYDAGRVRANVTTLEGETNWVNPVDSPAKLALVINDAAPSAARMLALYALGRLYQRETDWPHALRTYEKALTLRPSDPLTLASVHFYIGTLLPKVHGLEIDVLSQAIDHFTTALTYQPTWENLLYNRGTLYLGRSLLSPQDQGDLDAAIDDLTAVIERQPQRVDPLLNRGIALYERRLAGDLAAANVDFGRAIALAPDDYRGLYHRGLVKIRAVDEPWAADWDADLQAAAQLQPAEPSIQNGLCWGYALAGDVQAALPYCEQAVAGDSTGSSYDGRAMAYSQLGRYPEAAADLEHYLTWLKKDRPGLYNKMHGTEAEVWLETLRQGRNPFTAQVRADLR